MSESSPHILVVDDDQRLRELLKEYLGEQGFAVTLAADAAEARKQLAAAVPDIIILDVMMPGETGVSFAAELRKKSALPILMLSAMGDPEQRIEGLDAGVDDYMAKPFEPRELVLRLKGILRRSQPKPRALYLLRFGNFRLEAESGSLFEGDSPVYLTSTEQALLKALARHAGQPVSRDDLARLVQDAPEVFFSDRTVDVQITRLRKKIEPTPGKPIYIQTVRNAGYMLKPDPEM